MAFNKKTWKARQGLGLNKFSIDGATPVPITNQPDSVTQQGDALSAGNLNDLEDRIAEAFDDVETSKADKSEIEDLQSQINQHEARIANLEQISGEYVQTDLQDFSSVPTGKASFALMETLKGVSRVENQLMQYTTGYSQTNQYAGMFTHANDLEKINIVSGHKYLFMFVQPAGCALYRQNTTNLTLESGGTWSAPTVNTQRAFIATAGATAQETINSIVSKSETTATAYALSDMAICDITVYFNGNIPSNADTVAHIAQYYPQLFETRAFNTGEIKNSTYTKVDSVGFNRLDLDSYMETLGISKTGDFYVSAANIFAGLSDVDPLPIDFIPNTQYSFRMTGYGSGTLSSFRVQVEYSDGTSENMALISAQTLTTSGTTSAVGKSIIKATFSYGSGGSSNFNLKSLCVSVGTDTTKDSDYFTDTLTIPSVTLKGAGSVHDELDVESGEITRNVASVDLGSLNYGYSSTYKYFYANSVVTKNVGSDSAMQNVLAVGYVASARTPIYNDLTLDKVISVDGTGHLLVRNLAYTDSATFKTAMTGVTAYVEALAPTTESVTPTLNNTLKTEGGGTVYSDADVDGQFTLGFLNL